MRIKEGIVRSYLETTIKKVVRLGCEYTRVKRCMIRVVIVSKEEFLDFTSQKYPKNNVTLKGNVEGVERCKIGSGGV